MGAGIELFVGRKDGAEFPVEIKVSSIDTGHETVAAAVIRDITERKRAEADREESAQHGIALAALGHQALKETELQPLLEEAVRTAAEMLRVEYTKILELAPHGSASHLRAGLGWKDGYVGHATVPAGVESQAEFVIRLPLIDAIPERAETSGPPRAVSCRVAVIEDDPACRESLVEVLRSDGHEVEAAETGVEDVEPAESSHPQIVLIDVDLPDIDGNEVCRQLRPRLGGAVRLVAMTGFGQPQDRQRAIEAGFDVFVIKPVAPADLAQNSRSVP